MVFLKDTCLEVESWINGNLDWILSLRLFTYVVPNSFDHKVFAGGSELREEF